MSVTLLKTLIPARYALLFILSITLLLGLAAPLFFIGGPDWVSSDLVKKIWNFGHIIFFALLVIFLQWFKPLAHWRHWLWVTLAAFVLGGAIELLQSFVGRDASWRDVANDLCGVWLGLFWGQRAKGWVWFGRCASLVLIIPSLWSVVDSALMEFNLRGAFPQLNSFESRAELTQLRFNKAQVQTYPVREFVAQGEQALKVNLGAAPYVGLRVRVAYGDWSRYEFLALDIFNPSAEVLPLVVRVSDFEHDRGENQYSDRFNRSVHLNPGWNPIKILLEDIRTSPKTRSMVLAEVSNLGIFAVGLTQPREFYLDNIRLE